MLLLFFALSHVRFERARPAIKIGVLHSLTGAMATGETPLVDAVRLAVEEENRAGGVNGVSIEMVVVDCGPDAAHCAWQAEKLIAREGVRALFGCRTSDCLKAVETVVEKYRHLLFYPSQHEGSERSPDIVYTGAAPNQQVIPMALWALRHRGKRFYLIGSDSVFSRTANRVAKEVLLAQGGQMTGGRSVSPVAGDMAAAVEEIAAQRPDFILNTLDGDGNPHFFRALRGAGIGAEKIPVFSTGIAETELAVIGADLLAGHYAAWNYFQSVDSEENRAFVAGYKRRFGAERVLDDPMEASYIGVKLWADSVRAAGTADPVPVKNILAHQSMAAPQGIVAMNLDALSLWKTARIGRVRPDGQFDIVWRSEAVVHPEPSPFYRSRPDGLPDNR